MTGRAHCQRQVAFLLIIVGWHTLKKHTYPGNWKDGRRRLRAARPAKAANQTFVCGFLLYRSWTKGNEILKRYSILLIEVLNLDFQVAGQPTITHVQQCLPWHVV